ncbi:MAG: sucrase ferredoxin [Frankiaceae bacterium]
MDRWLLVDYAGPWGPKIPSDSRMARRTATHLSYLANLMGARLVFIRQAFSRGEAAHPTLPARPAAPPAAEQARLWWVDCRLGICRALTVEARLELDDVGDTDLLEAPLHYRPLVLVCTHGRHDACCAVRGRRAFTALRGMPGVDVWECSHIGGDRFAGNAVVLPLGVYLGRLDGTDPRSVVADLLAGQIHLDHYRGRCTLGRLAQTAEHHVRVTGGFTGLADVRIVEERPSGEGKATVRLRTGAQHVTVHLVASEDPPAALTCTSAPAPFPRWKVTRVVG